MKYTVRAELSVGERLRTWLESIRKRFDSAINHRQNQLILRQGEPHFPALAMDRIGDVAAHRRAPFGTGAVSTCTRILPSTSSCFQDSFGSVLPVTWARENAVELRSRWQEYSEEEPVKAMPPTRKGSKEKP